MQSVRYVCGDPVFGLKLHLLNIVKGSPMETMYPGYTPFGSLEEYVQLVTDMLLIIPPEITIHRLTADVPRRMLIAPEWSYKKRTILNGIAHELKIRGAYQGQSVSDIRPSL
jgi:radical SAM superfamily enzyme